MEKALIFTVLAMLFSAVIGFTWIVRVIDDMQRQIDRLYARNEELKKSIGRMVRQR